MSRLARNYLILTALMPLLGLLCSGTLLAQEPTLAEPEAATVEESTGEVAPEEASEPAEEPSDETPQEETNEQAEPATEETPASEEVSPDESEPAKEAKTDESEEDQEDPDGDNPGHALLDKALEVKITAEAQRNYKPSDMNQVVDLIDEALEEGLDPGTTDFAEQVLVATLLQRAEVLAANLFKQQGADPRRDPRLLQIRLLALTDLQRAVALDENQIDAWLLLGRLQALAGGNPSEARRALTKAIRLAKQNATDPKIGPMAPQKLAEVHALRGVTQKSPEDRLADFDKAVELSPDKLEFRLLRAKQRQSNGDPEACLEDIEYALTLAPDNAGVHELKALALLMQEKYDESLESFDRATELAPDAASPYQYRAEIFSQQEKTDQALEQLHKALELQPGNLGALLKRAELLSGIEQHDKALADVDSAMKVRPDLALLYLMRAQLLNQLGRESEADAAIDKLATAAPDNLEIQMQVAGYYANLERPIPAIKVLDRIAEKAPQNPSVLSLRGNMYLLQGKHHEALADFTGALEGTPEDSSVLNNYAWTLATSTFDKLRDGPRAIESATKACELTEYLDPVMLSTLAAAHAEAGDFEAAIRWSSEAVAKASEAGRLENFDGQLTDELESYQRGEPWRELQQVDVEPTELQPVEEPVLESPRPDALPTSRSSDF